MTEQEEFKDICTHFFDNIRKQMRICSEMEAELDDDLKNKRINQTEWKKGMDDCRRLRLHIREQLNTFHSSLKDMKKV